MPGHQCCSHVGLFWLQIDWLAWHGKPDRQTRSLPFLDNLEVMVLTYRQSKSNSVIGYGLQREQRRGPHHFTSMQEPQTSVRVA